MRCKNCKSKIKEGNRYCTKCGFDMKKAKEKSIRDKSHLEIKVITGIVVIGNLLLGIYIGVSIHMDSKTDKYYDKLICESQYSNYHIKYDKDKIITIKRNVIKNNFSYDSETEKERQKQLSVIEYLQDFQYRFESTTGGRCKYSYGYIK